MKHERDNCESQELFFFDIELLFQSLKDQDFLAKSANNQPKKIDSLRKFTEEISPNTLRRYGTNITTKSGHFTCLFDSEKYQVGATYTPGESFSGTRIAILEKDKQTVRTKIYKSQVSPQFSVRTGFRDKLTHIGDFAIISPKDVFNISPIHVKTNFLYNSAIVDGVSKPTDWQIALCGNAVSGISPDGSIFFRTQTNMPVGKNTISQVSFNHWMPTQSKNNALILSKIPTSEEFILLSLQYSKQASFPLFIYV
jgi:hypothetical protein